MKALRKIILISISLIVISLAVAFFYTYKLARRGLPDYSRNINIKGLQKEVKVYRDKYAVPHVYAATQHDLYLVTGYIMAQERLWQMDLLRRVTLGRLSEIFGDSFIETDLLLRSLRYSNKSKTLLKSSSPETKAALEAFALGVNQFIADNKGNYPFEFTLMGYSPEPWEPYQSLNLIGYMAWDLKAGWNELVLADIAMRIDSIHLAEILPDISKHKIYVFGKKEAEMLAGNKLRELNKLDQMGLDVLCGSNNWAISGAKSITGSPLLANDMHLSFGIPGIWMQIHQVVMGELNVEGLALPGQPLVIVGHNDSIAWGMTNTYVDNLDFYEETINPLDSNQYLFNNEWKKFTIQPEEIISKGGTKNYRNFRFNHRGPVVSAAKGLSGRVLTIRWAGDEESNELQSIFELNRAHNWNEFTGSFKNFRSISQNVAYADLKGNIGLFCAAGIPVRKRDKVYAVLPGSTDEYDWKGMVPFNELPYEYNPACGYISSANNRTIDSTYPFHIGSWYSQPYRIDRIRQMLNTKEKLSIEDFKQMQNDQLSLYAALFLERMLPILQSYEGKNEMELLGLRLLTNWDYTMSAYEIAPTLFEAWSYNLVDNLYRDELGDNLFNKFIEARSLSRSAIYTILISGKTAWADNISTPQKENLRDIAILSFQQTIQSMQDKYGSDTTFWNWGNLHKLTLSHPIAKMQVLDIVFKLNRGPFPVGGSFHTVSPFSYPGFEPSKVDHGASHHSIYTLYDWDSSISIIPTGMSGIPASKNYCDQTDLFLRGEYHPDPFTQSTVENLAVYNMSFFPAQANEHNLK